MECLAKVVNTLESDQTSTMLDEPAVSARTKLIGVQMLEKPSRFINYYHFFSLRRHLVAARKR